MDLSFEDEIIAFCIAIFCAIFAARANDELYMTSESIAEELTRDIENLGWVSGDDKVNFYVCPLALEHGFKLLKRGLVYYGVLMETKDVRMQKFETKGGGSKRFQVKVLKTNAWIGQLRIYQPQLKGQRDILLDKISGIRDILLVKCKLPPSQFKRLKDIFTFDATGKIMDVRPKEPAIAHVDPFSPVSSLRSLNTGLSFKELTPKHQSKVANTIKSSVLEFLSTSKNFSPADAEHVLDGKNSKLLLLLLCSFSTNTNTFNLVFVS
jgi:hypothetical protein